MPVSVPMAVPEPVTVVKVVILVRGGASAGASAGATAGASATAGAGYNKSGKKQMLALIFDRNFCFTVCLCRTRDDSSRLYTNYRLPVF